MDEKELVSMANQAREKAYAPYSNFRVGAALLTEDNKVFTGVNVENSSHGATVCAERTAVCKAVSEGYKEFKAIAIASDSDDYIYPCGICRQVLSEFNNGSMRIICSKPTGEYITFTLEELLPSAFKKQGGIL
jgi:cytidine deaminase